MRHCCRYTAVALVFFVLVVMTGCATSLASGQTEAADSTRIILTRHAERTAVSKMLTEKGHQRARDLVQAVGAMNITAIFSPDLERNLDTVRPLAVHLGIGITVKPARSTPLVDEIINEMLTLHAGETVLWVGNVDNLREMYWRLGGNGEGPITYGDLFIITVSAAGPVQIEKTTYGM